METLINIKVAVNGFIWGPFMLCFFVGTGIYLSFLLRFPQFRYFGLVWKELYVQYRLHRQHKNACSVSSFAAMSTAIAATVGSGNIAGVATALHMGGPGALFWMLICALFGMCTKFAEIVLAVHFRQKDENGHWRGGPMYVLEQGLAPLSKTLGRVLAVVFALMTLAASLGIGITVQSHSTAETLRLGFGIDELYSGILMSVATSLVVIGGLHRLASVAAYLVPFRAFFYIFSCLAILLLKASALPEAFASVFQHAFNDTTSLTGALAGWSVKEAISKGASRGVFSNEAGMGSAPMAHATAEVDHPVRQGLYGIFEVFLDTIAICSLTALVILVTGVLTTQPHVSGARLSALAFQAGLGKSGLYVLGFAILLFAYTTILGWYWYAETALTYLFGVSYNFVIKVLWGVLPVFGAIGGRLWGLGEQHYLEYIWLTSDILNGLMAVPNIIGILLLSGVLHRLVKDFDTLGGSRKHDLSK